MFTVKSPLEAVQDPQRLTAVRATVGEVIADSREREDVAVREYADELDSWFPVDLRLDQAAIDRILFEAPGLTIVDIKAVAV